MAADGVARFGVAGDPVSHSRSPQMHSAALAERGIDADYQRLPIPAALFDETVRALPGSGFRGINVTIPHKEAALALATSASDAARAIGAANTLTFDANGAINADNTDAPAVIGALTDLLGASPAGRTVTLLGAGGTARAAAWALADAGASVTIVNRTHSRARELAAALGVAAAERADTATLGILVNTTSIGLSPDDDEFALYAALGVDLSDLSGADCVVDFVYRDEPTSLIAEAQNAAKPVVTGQQLLARQGALSFAIWHGGEPPLDAMLRALG